MHIVHEGYIAAKIQLGYQMQQAESMTFSADGTGHYSINFNSRHIHLLAEDYTVQQPLVDSQAAPLNKNCCTHFLGIKPSPDNLSEEAIADWQVTIEDILDLYHCSPFGKRTGNVVRFIDVLIKLTGMNTDHCAKEKKDACKMEELKEWAVTQHLEEAILEKTISEVNELYTQGEDTMIHKAGGQTKWQALSDKEQSARQALMIDGVVAEHGK